MKAVIFDIGGVIVHDERMKERAFDAFGVTDRDEFWRLFNEAALPACRGIEPFSKCWETLSRALGREISPETARSLWIDDFEELISINQAVLDIARELKAQVKLGVVSNTIAEHAATCRRLGIYDPFDAVVLSCEVGMAKDDPAIFDKVLDALAVEAQEAVFIDDVPRFAASAAARGIRPIVFKNAIQLRAELQALGLLRVG